MHIPVSGLMRCFSSWYDPDYTTQKERSLCDFAGLVMPMMCLPKQWQHENVKELLIKGDWLEITIPALPSLETLLVFSHSVFAFDFVAPESLGRTIKRMSIRGEKIPFKAWQHQDLCKALNSRSLKLAGEWEGEWSGLYGCEVVIALIACDDRVPTRAELLEQAGQGIECLCRACPSCLGIGKEMLDKEDPPRAVWYERFPYGPNHSDW